MQRKIKNDYAPDNWRQYEEAQIKKLRRRTNYLALAVLIVFAGLIALNIWWLPQFFVVYSLIAEVNVPVKVINVAELPIYETTAYNPVSAQTDNTPCITASGYDVCEALERGEKICGANFVPFGTKLYIENYGECAVQDRMNSRYKNSIDIAMLDYGEAVKFGRQKLGVDIIE